MRDSYVQALIKLFDTQAEPQTILSGFMSVLKARGHEGLARPVLTAVLRTLEAKRPATVIQVASESDMQQLEDAITMQLTALGADPRLATTVTDPTVVGGYAVEHNQQRIDVTYKAALRTLYQTITNQ